ncbi:KpsF/GutQ family sugar-phosphate isomerase [Desulfohalobiaceae bacterium Ax17]|uniref:KpsF/GutQ family sugar-phosphate isomerase n=1 Tax=Desulfovulcanus ferrireducens TaxID=2831190 RepID=UPI00207BAFD4|nr:KpsF/GutQ family sugar-phosphate isomerase [Desulfovulcanus ferrireducens]MBT8763481.1 KpsF/GutQ family sugar-phosphate isomerase [Desulfovulcanus ferrireducens]
MYIQKSSDKDWIKIAKQVLDIEIQGLIKVKDDLNNSFTQAIELLGRCQGRIVVTGIGKSGLVGKKIAATLSSTGSPSFFLHPVEGAHGDIGMIRPEDVVLAISNSGETDELNSILPSLKSLGVKIIGLTSNLKSTMAMLCDLVIKVQVPKEACPLGLAPTASTTATLAIGDAIAVCLIKLKSFGKQDFKKYHPGGFLGQRLAKKVQEIMHSKNLPLTQTDTSLKQGLHVLNKGGLGVVLIVDKENKLKGIITDGDVRRIVCQGNMNLNNSINNYMVKNPYTADPNQSAASVLDTMEEKQITVIPIVDAHKRILGIVHLHDLLGKGKFKFS